MKALVKVTTKESDMAPRHLDVKGTFIQVEPTDDLPQGYGTTERVVVERGFNKLKLLTQNGKLLEFDDREDAENKITLLS